jgi:ubiquinone/menaquinone biosynthesis C-methylase UbiE
MLAVARRHCKHTSDAAPVALVEGDATALPFVDGLFDAVVSTQVFEYVADVDAALAEVARVLRPGGPLVCTFSNRCFPTKAVAIWQALDDAEHGQLIQHYLREAACWTGITALDRTPPVPGADPLLAVVARRR